MAKCKSKKQPSSADRQRAAMSHMLETWKLLRDAGHAAQVESDFETAELLRGFSNELAECQFKYIDHVLGKYDAAN